jgi:hypothetical protein
MIEPKKIGILTYHYVLNEGALLQAYSLAYGLNKYLPVCTAEIIDYRRLSVELRELRESIVSKRLTVLMRKFNRYLQLKRFANTRLPLGRPMIVTTDYMDAARRIRRRYDIVVAGSDEIWKIDRTRPKLMFPSFYWLNGDIGATKIAFAASANKTRLHELTESERRWLTGALNDYELIGVRDNLTSEFVLSMGIDNPSKVQKVPDPTFMLDLPPLDLRSILIDNGVNPNRPMAAILLTDKRLNHHVCDFFRRKGIQTVSLLSSDDSADVNLVGKLDPLQWGCIFKHFSFCVTGRFHGAIFSIKNRVPFIAIDDVADYGPYESKILSLLRDIDRNLERFYINGFDQKLDLETALQKLFPAAQTVMTERFLRDGEGRMKGQCLNFLQKIEKVLASDKSLVRSNQSPFPD